MEEKKSLKGSIIHYDRSSIEAEISDLLALRFGGDDFMDKTLKDLFDPYGMKDMDKAVARIKQAKENDEKIMIFWDYDVDGATSTSILMHFLKKIWIQVSYRLPHRVHDGYGLKNYFVDEIKEVGATLIITVDCGTKDIDVIKHAKSLWVDVIVTDHHAVPEVIPPEAVAIVNPKRNDCSYKNKNLAGAGVAFKLVHALVFEYFNEEESWEYIKETVDIAAIWTVADCMVLTGENRIIVKEWLQQLKRSRSRWIRTLIEDQINDDIDADIFGFTIGPRLNAAGRMDTPYKAVNLILNNSDGVDKVIADIEKLNEQRKFLTKQFNEEALGKINRDDNLLFYISPAIEHGIIWIVAGRLTEKFYKPSIVLKDEWDKLVASCRSPEYFSIIELLENYKDMFIGFGGHKQAAGFSISKEKFSEFKTKIINKANSIDFSKHKKTLQIDKVVKLEELGFGFLKKVNIYKPFWIGNTKPLFMVENLDYEKLEFLGKGRDHLKFTTKHGYKILWFFMWDYYEEIKRSWKPVSIIFDLGEDTWMGRKSLVLKLVDVVVG